MKNKEIFQYVLGGLIVAGFFALLILLVLSAVPTENKDLTKPCRWNFDRLFLGYSFLLLWLKSWFEQKRPTTE